MRPTLRMEQQGNRCRAQAIACRTYRIRQVPRGIRAGNHLPHAVIYPDSDDPTDLSGNGTDTVYDRVEFAYNAQGQVTWHKDQAGNIIQTDFDTVGRETHRRATTVAGGFDAAVERISTVYDSLGRVSTITQYDDPAVGSGNVTDHVKYAYDGWSNLTQFAMDRNSVISGGTDASDGYYDVDYTYTKATAGCNTIRKATMTYPQGSVVTYEYLSTGSLHDADASRVTRVKVGATAVASYAYNGMSNLVRTALLEPDVFMLLYDPADLDDYDRLDRFGRITQSKWTRDLATDKDFHHTSVTWDRNGNVTVIEDNVHSGLDVSYTNDNINRLTTAEEGTWGGSSISSRTRQQNWTLDQVGNWEVAQLDLDGDNNWSDADEYNDDRTHGVANELTARDTDDNGTDNYTLTYDGVGNLTDDGQAYEYVYDVWGRLRKVKNTSNQNLIAEYWYNGLGFRITFHADATGNGATDGSDPKYHLIYDERWRLVATYRGDDDNSKEAFVYHQAGLDGSGSSSYIDSVILRQKDANSGWTSAADGTMEQRRYYCQNWRNDVSVVLTSAAVMVEWAKFSAYGVPFGLPAADLDSDGETIAADETTISTWSSAYDVRADLDLDGDIDGDDATLANGYVGRNLGWTNLSHEDVANRIGYAGYQKDVNLDISHVRHRVLEPHLGRWTRRDPLGYVDGMGLYSTVASAPLLHTDPNGLAREACTGIESAQAPCPCDIPMTNRIIALLFQVGAQCKNQSAPFMGKMETGSRA